MENYVKGKVLGKGSFGTAVLAVSKLDGKNYVIKEVELARMQKAERDAAEQEARLLLALKHPNIVRCKECFTSGTKLCIVMDWCSEGDLYTILEKRKGQQLPEDTLLDWFVQICLGLKHVHDRKILHRDLKTQNVFVSAGGLLKLGDFGVSKLLNGTLALATTAVGTPYYLSPEICQNRKYNQKSDIWSLGCVLYELATMRHAFDAPNMRALIQKIIKGSFSPLPPSRSPELRLLITMLLTLDAKKRPSINDVLALPFIRARIARFLDQTLQQHEFSHTVIHGRPQPGQLVIALPSGAAPPTADKVAEAAAAAAAGAGDKVGAAAAGGGRIRLSAPAAMGPPQKLSAMPPATGPGLRQPSPSVAAVLNKPAAPVSRPPAAAVAPPPKPSKSPSKEQVLPPRGPSPTPPASGAQQQQRSPLVSPLVSPGGRVSPSDRDRQVSAAAEVDAVTAARQRALQVQQERQAMIQAAEARRAAEADAAAKAAAEAYKQRQAAAAAAAAEVARLRAADEVRAAEAAAARLEAERKRAEAKQQEEQRKLREAQEKKHKVIADAAAQKAAEEDRARARAGEAAQQRAAAEAKARALAAAEADRRQAAAAAREREREEMHQQMQQQKQEFLARQKAAAANRRKAEDAERGGNQVLPDYQDSGHTAAAAEIPVMVAAPKQRRPKWSAPSANAADDSDASDRHTPSGSEAEQNQCRTSDVEQPVGSRQAAAAGAGGGGGGSGDELSAQQRREVWEEMRAAAERNKKQLMAAEGGGLAAFLGVPDEADGSSSSSNTKFLVRQPNCSSPAPPKTAQQQQQHGIDRDQPSRERPRSRSPLSAGQQQQRVGRYEDFSSNRERLRSVSDRPSASRVSESYSYYPADSKHHQQGVFDINKISQNVMNDNNTEHDTAESGLSPWELRQRRLEVEQAARDAQYKEFQRQHWLEVKAAAARNKQAVLGELGVHKQLQSSQQQSASSTTPTCQSATTATVQQDTGATRPVSPHQQQQQRSTSPQQQQQQRPPSPQYPQQQQQQQSSLSQHPQQQQQQQQQGSSVPCLQQEGSQSSDGDEGTQEFAAMLSDMHDIVEQQPEAPGSTAEDDEGPDDNTQDMVLAGRFMLEGKEVRLPVSESDSLACKVEALRMFLEEELGTQPFLKVYHRLESLSGQDDEEQVSQEFLQLLGSQKLAYVQLVNQLIIAEETMHMQHAN